MFGHINDSRRHLFLWGLLLLLLLLLASMLAQEANCLERRRPLARTQRQIITNELATGITGTGTSFNSIYSNPFYTQQQQQQTVDDYNFPGSLGKSPAVFPASRNNVGGGGSWRGFGVGSKVGAGGGGGYGVKGGSKGGSKGGFRGGSGIRPTSFYGYSQSSY